MWPLLLKIAVGRGFRGVANPTDRTCVVDRTPDLAGVPGHRSVGDRIAPTPAELVRYARADLLLERAFPGWGSC